MKLKGLYGNSKDEYVMMKDATESHSKETTECKA